MNEIKSWFSYNISKIEKPLASPIKEKKKKTQIINIRNERDKTTTDSPNIKKTIRQNNKQH